MHAKIYSISYSNTHNVKAFDINEMFSDTENLISHELFHEIKKFSNCAIRTTPS